MVWDQVDDMTLQINPTHHRLPFSYNLGDHHPELPSPPKLCKSYPWTHQDQKTAALHLQVSSEFSGNL